MIDTLKKTVPIWKKEQFVDGAVWADGEPFPEEIAGSGAVSAGLELLGVRCGCVDDGPRRWVLLATRRRQAQQAGAD